MNVLYGTEEGLDPLNSQTFTQQTAGVVVPPETSSGFGSAVGADDFDGDGFDDVAIAANNDVSAADAAGAITVLRGSMTRLGPAGSVLLSQDSPGVGSTAEAGDGFGAELAVGDINGDGRGDLVAGSPREDVGAVVDAGAVNVFFGAATGLSGRGSQLFAQSSKGVTSDPERGDHFAEALALGDFNGDGRDDLAVGAPDESVGTVSQAGAINVLYSSGGRLTGTGGQLFTQDTSGVTSAAEPFDQFAGALVAGRIDPTEPDDLVVGVPNESVGIIVLAGAVNVLYSSRGHLAGAGGQLFSQDTAGIEDFVEPDDSFGSALG